MRLSQLQEEIIAKGACTQCGSCVGLNPENMTQVQTWRGPYPKVIKEGVVQGGRGICPAYGVRYRELNELVFGKSPDSWLLGNYRWGGVVYAANEEVRRGGASGGVISRVLIWLLEKKLVDGVVVASQSKSKPWQAVPLIVETRKQVLAAAGSIYVPVMTNSILSEVKRFKGRLAYVGLPDQVASLRKMQQLKNKAAMKIKFVIGPYVGTAMYPEALASYMRSNGYSGLNEIKELRFRAGEWPGYLEIVTTTGKKLRASKFYYNYLIPFYITRNSLTSVDFTNELTDISVGDAWHPKYESLGKGFSVVLARSSRGLKIIKEMMKEGVVKGEEKREQELVNMHGHMLDFKKRGAFIRLAWMRRMGKSVPKYDYEPKEMPAVRYVVELVISGLFFVGRWRWVRNTVEKIPIEIMGRLFGGLRERWKQISRSSKRKGLMQVKFRSIRDV